MSIWNGIDRPAFERDLRRLVATRQNQGGPLLQRRLMPQLLLAGGEDENGFVLAPDVENQLANDFAFLSAATTLPRDVSAAALTQANDSSRLVLTIAANQGVAPTVKRAMRSLLDSIEERAKGNLSLKNTQDACRDTMLPIHRDRIFGRLGSSKTCGQRGSQVCMEERVAALVEIVQAKEWQHGALASKLVEQLQQLRKAIVTAESAANKSEHEKTAISSVLRLSYEIVEKGSLIERLRSLGIQQVPEESREIRDIRGLGNYWRIFRYLAKISGRSRRAFKSIDLNVLRSGPSRRWDGLKQYVHAEIQIVAYFDLYSVHRPRFIGTSKKPCFLCYCFIRAHGTYSVSKSHGEVFKQWTIPDDSQWSVQVGTKFNWSMKRTAIDVEEALRKAKKGPSKSFYSHPLQTVSKLLVDTMSSISVSPATTVLAQPQAEHNEVFTLGESAKATSVLCLSQSQAGESPSQQSIALTSDSATSHSAAPSEQSSNGSLPKSSKHCEAFRSDPGYLKLNEVEIFLEIESGPKPLNDISLEFASCSIRPTCASTSYDLTRVDADGLYECSKTMEIGGTSSLRLLLCGCAAYKDIMCLASSCCLTRLTPVAFTLRWRGVQVAQPFVVSCTRPGQLCNLFRRKMLAPVTNFDAHTELHVLPLLASSNTEVSGGLLTTRGGCKGEYGGMFGAPLLQSVAGDPRSRLGLCAILRALP
nr:hypothetical protein CFP56_72666 [Quercus suber]